MSDSQDRKRKRIDKGIYRDRWGLAATVSVGAQQRERRFPPETSLKTIKAWRDETRVALRKAHPAANAGTFAADVVRYLAGRTQMPTYNEREAHLALWSAEFGHRKRDTIQTIDIDAVLSRWLGDKLSPYTVINRRTALQALWTSLDGKGAPNPVRAAIVPETPTLTARAVDYETIQTILAAMPDVGQGIAGKDRDDQSKTKARLAVIAYTGLPHALIKQLTPASIDWVNETVTVAKRRKGKGVEGRTLPLTAQGLDALQTFAALECWGSFSNASMRKSWLRACKAANVKPAPRVYDLRHSFATKLYRETGDPKATAAMLMHSEKSQMMDRYTIGGVASRLTLAAAAFTAAVPIENSGSKSWQYAATRKKTA